MVVAFSGGPDSTALLWGLAELESQLREKLEGRVELHLTAAHLDHGLDPDSSRRASVARATAQRLEVEFVSDRIEVDSARLPGESLEEAARRVRYEFLASCLEDSDRDWILVGHHADDQAETVLLRLLFGTGIPGLGAMRPRHRRILRPLLDLRRTHLADALAEQGLVPALDPTNTDPARPRNLVRHRLLPALESPAANQSESLVVGLGSLARTAQGAADRCLRRLATTTDVRTLDDGNGADLDLGALRSLPAVLRPYALLALHRAARLPQAAPAGARTELDRQLARGGPLGCDCGNGWRWSSISSSRGSRLRLAPAPGEVVDFSYRLTVPGELPIPELGSTLVMKESERHEWMLKGSGTRAALSLPLVAGQSVLVRNRRPGDRVQPLGCRYERKLKDVLIDKRVAREVRSSLPLLVVDGRIAWIPGVTIDESFRIASENRVWVAELVSTPDAPVADAPSDSRTSRSKRPERTPT